MAIVKTLDDLLQFTDKYDVKKIMLYHATEDSEIIMQNTTIFDIYRRYLNSYVAKYTVSEKYRKYYRGKPYLLSADIYGTPNLGWMIMKLNNQSCASKFYVKQTINLIPKPTLDELYDTLLAKSSDRLESNWNTYLTILE